MPNAVVLKANWVIGSLNQLSAIIPLERDNKKVSSNKTDNSNVTITENNPVTPEKQWLPTVDLSHLTHDQIPLFETLLRENFDLFRKNDSDIGKLNELN